MARALRKPEAYIFAAFGAVTALMTYPAITLLSATYAEPRDPLGAIWQLWWLKYSFEIGVPATPVPIVGFPFGVQASVYVPDPLHALLSRGIAIVTNETVTYNLFILFSFFLSAVAMYYLVRRLTGSRPAAAVSGFIFGFSPFMLMHGKEHLTMAAAMWLPLFVISLLHAWKKRSTVSIALCGAVLIVLSMFNSHYGLLAVVFFLGFLCVMAITGGWYRRRKRDWTLAATVVVTSVVVLAALIALSLATSRGPGGEAKTVEIANTYSARPWDYFIPSAEGTLLGWATRDFIVDNLHGSFLSENSLFLGYAALALAACGAFMALRRRDGPGDGGRSKPEHPGENGSVTPGHSPGHRHLPPGGPYPPRGFPAGETRRVAWVMIACVVTGFVLSMPPTIRVFGARLYLPSYIVNRLVPQVRAFARFGLLVFLGVAVLAGIGVAGLLDRRWFFRRRNLVAFCLCVLVLLEFMIIPPFYSLDTKEPSDYARWLSERPGAAATAIYPFYYADDFKNYGYLFQQRHHARPLLNGMDPDSEGELYRQVLLGLDSPGTPGILRLLGAEYVLVIPELLGETSTLNYVYELDPEEALASVPGGLEVEEILDDAVAYRITAPPATFVALFGGGAYQAYVDEDGRVWHPGGSAVELDVISFAEREVAARIAFEAASPSGSGELSVLTDEERVAGGTLGIEPASFVSSTFTLDPGPNRVVLRSTGPPVRLTGIPDYSDVEAAILVGNVRVETPQAEASFRR